MSVYGTSLHAAPASCKDQCLIAFPQMSFLVLVLVLVLEVSYGSRTRTKGEDDQSRTKPLAPPY